MTISIENLIQSDRIPSLPEVALRVVDLTRDPVPDFDEITRVIRSDPAIASRIMRTVNSALFGLRQRVSSIDAAVPILGANLVRTLVLSFCLAEHRGPADRYRRYYQGLWRSSMDQAALAEALAERVPGTDESVWFLAALLQDIGRHALLSADPEEYSRLLKEFDDGDEMLAAEQDSYGFTHTDVSVQLCLRWRLDNYLVDAIAKHHSDVRGLNLAEELPASPTMPLLPNALRCARVGANFIEGLRSKREVSRATLERSLHDGFGILADEVNEMLTDVDLRVGEVAALFAVDLGEFPSMEQVLAQAQTTLAKIALTSQLEIASVRRHLEDAMSGARPSESQPNQDAETDACAAHLVEELLGDAAVQCRRQDLRLGVLGVGIDRFPSFSESHPLDVRISVLQQVVGAIRRAVREDDSIVRYDDGEFLVVVPVNVNETLVRIAERVRTGVSRIELPGTSSSELTCSVGGVVYRPSQEGAMNTDRILQETDQALALAKTRGGDQCVLFELDQDSVTPMALSDYFFLASSTDSPTSDSLQDP